MRKMQRNLRMPNKPESWEHHVEELLARLEDRVDQIAQYQKQIIELQARNREFLASVQAHTRAMETDSPEKAGAI